MLRVACAVVLIVAVGNARAQVQDGGVCASDSVCASKKCNGDRCCAASTNDFCAECDNTGSCSGCEAPRTLKPSGTCFLSSGVKDGKNCANNAQCANGNCGGGKCCQDGTDLLCEACDALGVCTACQVPRVLSDDGKCVVADGGACDTNSVCANNLCLDGRCCVKGTDVYCDACDQEGICSVCESTRTLRNGKCASGAADGATCSDNTACASGKCHGSQCCIDETDEWCDACDAEGYCVKCKSGYILNGTGCADSDAASHTVISVPMLIAGTITLVLQVLF